MKIEIVDHVLSRRQREIKPRRIFLCKSHLAGKAIRLQTTAGAEFDGKLSSPMMRMAGVHCFLEDGADLEVAVATSIAPTLLASWSQ